MLSKFIKQLRLKNNFNQSFVAEHISVSRPTYLEIEKGTRDLTITEAQKLADLFGLSLDSLLNQNEIVTVVDDQKTVVKKHDDIRISIPQNNLEKFKQVLLYILTKVGSKPNIGETAIYKLLYFIDFDYYEKYEEQLIGAKYIRNNYGPTPVHFKKVIEDMIKNNQLEAVQSKFFEYPQKKYLPKKTPILTKLNGQEMAHINDVLNRLSDKTARELSAYSHTDTPWMVKKQGEVLDYESVFYRDNIHSVRDNSHDQL
jgi:transcriptional regulator with XRE-family HTH domain